MKYAIAGVLLASVGLMPAEADAATLNVQDYGAYSGDGQDDAPAISRALREANPGDTVFFPAGRYDVASTVVMRSGVDVIGSGCGRSVLRRSGQRSGQIMFLFDGVAGTEIRSLEFDYAGAPEFYRALGFRGQGSNNITIADNCFFEPDFQEGRGDRWAVELSSTQSPTRRVLIANNRVRGNLQLTAGGGAGLQNVVIRNNHIVGARANGIAISTVARTAKFANITIADNLIENSSAIGIYVGPDKPQNGGGRFEKITISGNRILGLRNRFSYGIFVRAPSRGMDALTITSNFLDGRGSAKAIAIRLLDDHGRGTRQFSSVRICGNSAEDFSRGIWLQRVFGGVIVDNLLATIRPFEAAPDQNADLRLKGTC